MATAIFRRESVRQSPTHRASRYPPGMATRGWGGSIAIAIGVAAGAAAAQLGVAYGLGTMAWTSATDAAGERDWLASLAWTTWIAAASTVLGAVVADRLSTG